MTTNSINNIQISYYERAWDFIMGPTPIAPEVKMKEILLATERSLSEQEMDCEMKSDELIRVQKKINRAAAKNDETMVRLMAKDYVSKDKEQKRAVSRLERTRTDCSSMRDIQVKGHSSKNMLEFIQCHNRLLAPVANLNASKAIMGQYNYQQIIMKTAQEDIDDSLKLDSNEEEEEEVNNAVEELVNQAMSLSSLNLISQLPTINNTVSNNTITNAQPAATAVKIQQFLEKK